MKSFLQQVADYYLGKRSDTNGILDLSAYTFVFPNKRSSMFMRKYLKDGYKTVGFLPRLATITSFTQEFNETPLASTTELLFNLYEAYLEVKHEMDPKVQPTPFDKFAHWGNILLSDFNDVDSYMVDEVQLFKNIESINEIKASYLTQAQVEVAEMLGIKQDLSNMLDDVSHFWTHVPHDGKHQAASSFVSLWQLLLPLYQRFNQKLDARKIAYSGKLSKMAAEKIDQMGLEDFCGRRFVFVGFNVLSTSRIHIFKRLQQLGIAEFFWDIYSPMLHKPGCKAGDIILPLSKKFPHPEDFIPQQILKMPKAHIYPVPSKVGQTKVASDILRQWYSLDSNRNPDKLTCAVVLPNELLLMPMLFSVPDDVKSLNVAMRLNFSDTPFAHFMTAILHMQQSSRLRNGVAQFFYKHVIEVLSHPYANLISPGECHDLKVKIQQFHLYNVSAEMVAQEFPELAFIFSTISTEPNLQNTYDYLCRLLDHLEKMLRSLQDKQNKDKQKRDKQYEIDIIAAYRQATDQVYQLAIDYGIDMPNKTFFSFLRQILAIEDMHFNGDPVRGLQIMGMRDARVLDFDNLIITSLNERVMPKHNSRPSLIPPSLRSGYFLPTPEQEEISWSYQFYRLISRAKNLYLTYDSRISDMATGEISRYLLQLQLLYPTDSIVHTVGAGHETSSPLEISIDKSNPYVREQLERYKAGAENPKVLSASTLKKYISCPLRFFLDHVMGLNIETRDPEFMDAASYGDIVHKVAEEFYKSLYTGTNDRHVITKAQIDNILADPTLDARLLQLATKHMGTVYYRMEDPQWTDLPGEGRVLSKIIVEYVKLMLTKEKENGDFIFHSAEDKLGKPIHQWSIGDSHSYNFMLSIDRIDYLEPDGSKLRFIDYKTGSDALKAPSLESLFTEHKYGAIFQLLLYCLAYSDLTDDDAEIQPIVYKFVKLAKEGIPALNLEKQDILDYHQLPDDEANSLKDSFRQRLLEMLDEMFDCSEGSSFKQCDDSDNCRYCSFVHLCGRYEPPTR